MKLKRIDFDALLAAPVPGFKEAESTMSDPCLYQGDDGKFYFIAAPRTTETGLTAAIGHDPDRIVEDYLLQLLLPFGHATGSRALAAEAIKAKMKGNERQYRAFVQKIWENSAKVSLVS